MLPIAVKSYFRYSLIYPQLTKIHTFITLLIHSSWPFPSCWYACFKTRPRAQENGLFSNLFDIFGFTWKLF